MAIVKFPSASGAPDPVGFYSPVAMIPAGMNLIETSGQIPIRPGEKEITTDNLGEQMTIALENAKACVEAAGGTLDDVYRVDVMLAPGVSFPDVDQAYRAFFTKYGVTVAPTRAAAWWHDLPKKALVELTFRAATDPKCC